MIENLTIKVIQIKSQVDLQNCKKKGNLFLSMQKFLGLFILFCFSLNCSDKNKTIGKITEQLDSSKFVTPEIIANYPDSSTFNEVFVKAFVSSTNFDKKINPGLSLRLVKINLLLQNLSTTIIYSQMI